MSFATIATIALAASASFVSAAPVAIRGEAPSTYYEGYLEDYDVYHARYIALDCKTQHNTTFFDACCHPILANETVTDVLSASCSVNATVTASVASSIAEYTSTATASASATADLEAESEYSSASSSVESAASTASYEWVTESESATSASASASASATATASLDVAAEYAHKTASSSEHQHTASASASDSDSASPTSTSTEAEYTASSTTSSSAAATSTASSSGSVMTGGYATFFYQDGVAGECGTVHSDSDYVIAIDSNGWWSDYESNSASPYCGKSITITNTNNGKSVTAVVADVCPTCVSNNSLDLSVGAFTAIASESDGEVPITWVWA